MDKSFVEAKSATWQKVFISLISLPLVGVGVACWLSPFVPVFQGPQPSLLEALVLGSFFVVGGFGVWWPVMKYSIRADNEGITQTNGFFRQSVRWIDVTCYYMEPNRRFHKERWLHIEPVMFNKDGAIIFRGFAHILVSTRKIIEQRRELWQFVEAQLEGKKIEVPSPNLDPEVLARRTLEVNWSKKTVLWKIGRVVGLVCYALFWLAVSMAPIYYVLVNNITLPKPWGAFMVLPMFLGPLLPHIIWLKVKKRKIAKELKMRVMAD